MMNKKEPDWLHKEYPKTCTPNDFWGQVKRTVKGVAVSEVQINMIVDAVRAGLKIEKGDILLDLGCGNGALSRYFFPYCSGTLGVDFSPYLIQVAKKNFERQPDYIFLEDDALSYVGKEQVPKRFTKALCYGAFSYLPSSAARAMLAVMYERFLNVTTLFIGNIPDKEKKRNFFPAGTDFTALLDDHASALGIWRTRDEMVQIVEELGWTAEIRTMPDGFYAAHYRFDLVLHRSKRNDSFKSNTRNMQW